MTDETQGDGVFVASSDLISKVMQKYFKDVMFKMDVEVVDLKPTDSGYAFNLRFADEDIKVVIENIIVEAPVNNKKSKPKVKSYKIKQGNINSKEAAKVIEEISS